VTGWADFPLAWAMPDWLDGAFSAGDLLMVTVLRRFERIGYIARLSEPLRLCSPRRSAAGLQACVRRSIGGLHRRIDRLMRPLRSLAPF